MTSPAKRKGDSAEREVQEMLRKLLGVDCRRALGAGRADDVGDIHGIPDTVVQVANYADLDRAVREKLYDLERQIDNAHAAFGALFVRRRGGSYVVAMTPAMFAELWHSTQTEGVIRS